MKKLKFALLAAALAALFCVPAFATDCEDCGTPLTPYSCTTHICADGCGVMGNCDFDPDGECCICTYSIYDRDHDFVDGFCSFCGLECDHDFIDGVCAWCGLPVCEYWGYGWGHDWSNGICARCGALCSHDWYFEDDYSDFHFCVYCDDSALHVNDSDGYCVECGYRDPFFGTDYCGCFNLSSMIIFYAEDDHYALCPEHFKIISFASLRGNAFPHVPDSCDFCLSFADSGGYLFPYSAYTSGALYCENFGEVWFSDSPEALFSGKFAFLYDDMTHYASCLDCGAYCDLSVLGGPVPHTGTDCELCSQISNMGITPSPFPSESPDSPSVLSSITDLVGASVGWLSSFVLCIVSTPLLLVFFVSIFAILGLYLIKRFIYL